jgi:hypothetical protein
MDRRGFIQTLGVAALSAGVHPTSEGARRRGEVIASFIEATF